MSTSCIENFFVERNAFIKIISESVNLIKSIYSGKNDVNLDCVMYTWERERLLLIIKDLESMYLKYQDVLFLLPKEESRAEFQYGKKLIRAALDVINSPPAHIKLVVVRINQTVKAAKVQQCKFVPPIRYEVVPQVAEKVSHAFVKRATSKFVTVHRYVVAESIVPSVQQVVVSNKSCVVFTSCIKNTIEVCDDQRNEVPNVKRYLTKVIDSSSLKCGYDLNVTPQSMNLANIAVIQVKYMLRNSKRHKMWKKFYNRIFLRSFWNYFLFSDFNLYFFKMSLCASCISVAADCLVLCLLFLLVKNLFFTVGSVTAVWQ